MSIGKSLFIGIFFLSLILNAEAQKKGQRESQRIYGSAINTYYASVPASIVVTDSTINEYIVKTNFTDIANDYDKRRGIFFKNEKLDSSWKDFLKKADLLKHNLGKSKIPEIEVPYFEIKLANNDSVNRVFNRMNGQSLMKTFGASDNIQFSDIIQDGKKAIVELSRGSEGPSGNGVIFFLKKIKRKWIVVSHLNTWIS